MDGTQILVTGGSGFVGRAVVQAVLTAHPHWRVSILDQVAPPAHLRRRIHRFLQADITSAESVNNAFRGYTPDLVVHTAGVIPARELRYSTKSEDWEKVKAINYGGTTHVLDATMASGCRRFVYTSSCTVIIDDLDHDYHYFDETAPIGRATLHYGRSKTLAERYVMAPEHADAGLIACALRPSTIIGPGEIAVMSVMHDCIAKGEAYFIIGDGDNSYDFMYIDNAAYAHMLAIENLLTTQTAAGQVFCISNQEPVYFWDFMAYVWAQFGHHPKFRIHIPVTLAWLAAAVLEWITWLTGTASTIDRGSVRDSVRTNFANNDKARRILGYEPRVGLADGVRLSCEGYKRHLGKKAAPQPEEG